MRLDVDLGPDVSLGSQLEPTRSFRPTAREWCTCRKGGSLPGGSISPPPLSLQERREHYAPFFSPDGQWVAFFTAGKLQKISVEGGSAITLCNAALVTGGSWGEDGNIIAALTNNGGLSRIPSAGGPPTPVTDLQSGETTHRWPQILPGGKAVLFTASATRRRSTEPTSK